MLKCKKAFLKISGVTSECIAASTVATTVIFWFFISFDSAISLPLSSKSYKTISSSQREVKSSINTFADSLSFVSMQTGFLKSFIKLAITTALSEPFSPKTAKFFCFISMCSLIFLSCSVSCKCSSTLKRQPALLTKITPL